jgi:hypothetical protein
MKKDLTYLWVTLWFVIIVSVALLSTGCNPRPTIEPGDKVVKCVIDSMSMEGPRSTIESNYHYYYYTDCGERVITNRNDVYKIGDTVTYVYKKIK